MTIAASSFLFRNWTVRKKLHIGFTSLIFVLALNVILTSYEISRLQEASPKLSYLVYLNIIGIISGCLFIWIITQTVLRPMKRIIHQLENRTSSESLKLYSNDEIGQLARAVNYMKKNNAPKGIALDEKNLLLETILSHSIESIFVFNGDGRVSTYSKGFKSITRYNNPEKETKNVSEIFTNFDLEKAFSHLATHIEDAPFYNQRVFLKTKKGKRHMVDCSICCVKSEEQKIYIGILKELDASVKIKEGISKAFKPNFFKKFVRK